MNSTRFTFLATILILVLLSASLVLRSWILRRRYRQRFQHALLFPDAVTGQFDSLGGFRRSTRPLPPSPILWDTWIVHSSDKPDTLSTITPVAVRCTPFQLPLASSSASSPQQSTTQTPSPSSLHAQSRPSIFSQLRLPSPFSLSLHRFSPLSSQTRLPATLPTLASSGSRLPPPAAPTSSDTSICTERDAGTLAICVLIAMPALSAPVHRPVSDAKGKSAGPPDFQAHRCSGDVNPLLPSSLHRSAAHIQPDPPLDEEGLPLLEFGILELRTVDLVW